MQRIKVYALILAFGCFPITGRAAESAQEFAAKVQNVYDQTQHLSIQFIQKTHVALLEREVEKKGEAKFKKPGKFSIAYSGKGGRHYLSNGKILYIYEAGDNQVQNIPLNDETVPAEALSFLGGLGKLKQEFAVEEVDEKKWVALKRDKGAMRWLELTPLKKRSTIDWIIMGFDPQSFLAREVYLYTDSQNLSHYIFTKVQTDVPFTDSDFELKR